HTIRAQLGELLHNARRSEGRAHGVTEGIATDVTYRPEAKGEMVLRARRISVVPRHRLLMELLHIVACAGRGDSEERCSSSTGARAVRRRSAMAGARMSRSIAARRLATSALHAPESR